MTRGGVLARTVAEVAAGDPAVEWGVQVRDVRTGEVLAAHDAEVVRPVASVGKLLLLVEVAEQLTSGRLPPDLRLTRTAEDQVADSGLWQHLRTEALPVADLAALVAAVSDNLATNVLLRHVGLAAVSATADRLGLRRTALLDRVRDHRGPDDPPTLARGTAAELAGLMCRLATAAEPGGPTEWAGRISPAAARQVLDWLALDTDTSMVAAPLALDPLAHVHPDRGISLRHKTGSDTGTRADVGVVRGRLTVAYAVLAHWDTATDRRDIALAGMHRIGAALAAH